MNEIERIINEKIAYAPARRERRTTLKSLREDRNILIERGFTGDELESEFLALVTEVLFGDDAFAKFWLSRINLDRFTSDALRLQEASSTPADQAVFEMMVDSVINYIALGNQARFDTRY